jgi:phosphate acetyltransferase
MEDFLKQVWDRAKENPKRIVFAEGSEPRVAEAIKIISKENLAIPVVFGEPSKDPRFETLVKKFMELRGAREEEARSKMRTAHYFATMLVHEGEADGMIAGPSAASRERILPALEIIKTKEKGWKASGLFFMVLPTDTNPDAANGGVLVFADCAVNTDPSVETLTQIASDSAASAKQFGLEQKIALLSFSTGENSQTPQAQKLHAVAKLVKQQNPSLSIEGPMQVDAALIDAVGQFKDPSSPLAGHANILIFPDLEAGNIAYKLVERLAGAKAIGPILQGLQKPVNELSRGASVEDIVHLTAFTTVQAQMKY